MPYILCIETATTNCSVSLSKNGKLVAIQEDFDKNYSHAERLHIYIDQVLKKENISYSDLMAVSVSKGPGSYTGLRIGVSSAKGLCYALDIPLISIPTLESLAYQVKIDTGYVVPMLDARRMEVYSCVFSNDYNVLRSTEAEILTENSFLEYLEQGKVCFVGNGVEKFSNICSHTNAVFVTDKLPSANEMVTLSYQKFLGQEFEDVSYFEPYYLKDFVAK